MVAHHSEDATDQCRSSAASSAWQLGCQAGSATELPSGTFICVPRSLPDQGLNENYARMLAFMVAKLSAPGYARAAAVQICRQLDVLFSHRGALVLPPHNSSSHKIRSGSSQLFLAYIGTLAPRPLRSIFYNARDSCPSQTRFQPDSSSRGAAANDLPPK